METTSTIGKRLTSAQREELLNRYRGSNLTQREFAQQQGIGLSTLQRWLHWGVGHPEPAVQAFVPVPNLLSATRAPAAYRLQWPGGLTLELRAGFVPQELASLLALLPAL